jgi:hypothetical protein
MAISVKPDNEVNSVMLRGLDLALQAHIGVLFGVLCSGASSDASAALERFSTGIGIARKAYLDAKTIIDEEYRSA